MKRYEEGYNILKKLFGTSNNGLLQSYGFIDVNRTIAKAKQIFVEYDAIYYLTCLED